MPHESRPMMIDRWLSRRLGMCVDGSDAKNRTILSYIAMRDMILHCRAGPIATVSRPRAGTLAATGRMNSDVLPSSRDDLDSTVDVS